MVQNYNGMLAGPSVLVISPRQAPSPISRWLMPFLFPPLHGCSLPISISQYRHDISAGPVPPIQLLCISSWNAGLSQSIYHTMYSWSIKFLLTPATCVTIRVSARHNVVNPAARQELPVIFRICLLSRCPRLIISVLLARHGQCLFVERVSYLVRQDQSSRRSADGAAQHRSTVDASELQQAPALKPLKINKTNFAGLEAQGEGAILSACHHFPSHVATSNNEYVCLCTFVSISVCLSASTIL